MQHSPQHYERVSNKMTTTKPIHTLVLDTGALIKNEPPISTIVGQSEVLVTVPAILAEIKDPATRSRVETQLHLYLTVRSPTPASVKFVTDFARRTGDLAVLSRPDIQIIALTYEIECERNHGDWRLRRVPGQKRTNGAPPVLPSVADGGAAEDQAKDESHLAEPSTEGAAVATETDQPADADDMTNRNDAEKEKPVPATEDEQISTESSTEQHPETLMPEEPAVDTDDKTLPNEASDVASELPTLLERTSIVESEAPPTTSTEESTRQEREVSEQTPTDDLTPTVPSEDIKAADSTAKVDSAQNSASSQEESDSDSEGWITPSNLKIRQAEESTGSNSRGPEPKLMQVAVMTTDYAMQNVILQMNLNLLSPSLMRVKHMKTFVLRCHACFQVSKDMTKQFCPKCGQPTLTRVSCSTNANGEFKLHLKKNMQWNTRGDRFSIPKAVHGSPHGRIKGGGKGGWGNELILAEDQKEYERASTVERKHKERSLMDEDYLPSILTGDRNRGGGRVKVGAGRNVNSKKR